VRDASPETPLESLKLERPRVLDQEPETLAKPVRVLHVLDHSWPLLSGYSVRSHSLIAAQKSIGFLPEAITSPLQQLDDPHSRDATVEGISFRRTPLPQGLVRHALDRRFPLLRSLAVVRLLRDQILSRLDQVRFDVVHAHSPALCGLAALQATRARGIPLVYEIRAFWEDAAVDQHKTHPASLQYHLSRRLEGYVARRADAVVGIAQHILDDLHGRGLATEKLFHVPNGVDAERFAPRPPDASLFGELGLGNEPVMGFIGSLYRYEGMAWLVRAAAELRSRGVLFQILIVGQGEEMPEIHAAVRETGAQAYVRTVGQVPHDQVQRYYSLMDVMVFPRRRIRLTELTTPLKPLEAMAQGKAVLASNVGGIRELVGPGGACLLFEPDDVEDFCRKATRLLVNERFRYDLGESARQMVSREKDWKILARSYEAVYDFAGARQRRLR
jgi:PEP-CTERM/exosortase A-associated glycosyltransferase